MPPSAPRLGRRVSLSHSLLGHIVREMQLKNQIQTAKYSSDILINTTTCEMSSVFDGRGTQEGTQTA